MQSIKRMGILYGRLGLSTDPELIERRGAGVRAAAEALQEEDIIGILKAAYGLGTEDGAFAFLSHFSSVDPTFDVRPSDREAALLAASVVDYVIEDEAEDSAKLALAMVTGSCTGVRSPAGHVELIGIAEKALAFHQGNANTPPEDREYNKQPNSLVNAISAVGGHSHPHFQTAAPIVTSALQELGKYAEENALEAARSDNVVLAYVRRLEQEVRTYWWVAGGWSIDADMLFSRFHSDEAALRAGKELADKNHVALGLFAAPALISMLVERGRENELAKVSLREAAVRPSREWRRQNFGASSSGPLAQLLPITTALGYAAESDDAADWEPRFKRLTGVDPSELFDPIKLGVQLYRECLTMRALA